MSQSWRDVILAPFIPQLARLTLVADPDSLLADETVQAGLKQRGFELVEYQEAVAFRYFFETTVRPRWLAGDTTELVVVVPNSDPKQIPFDWLRQSRWLSLGLNSLFPRLTYSEVAALQRRDLDVLYTAQTKFAPTQAGETSSRDFILRHVFGLDATLVKDEADLLTLLLRLHLGQRSLPAPFVSRLVQQLGQDNRFADWPLASLLADSATLYAFLQERWPLFLETQGEPDTKRLHDTVAAQEYAWQWPGPAQLPWAHPEIRAFVDTLFLEGKLRPVTHPRSDKLKHLWVAVGLKSDPAWDRDQRLARLLAQLSTRLPGDAADHREWGVFAAAWAEAIVLHHLPLAETNPDLRQSFNQLQAQIDQALSTWLAQRYKYLSTLSPHPPVMGHHIPRSLARTVKPQGQEKVALVVMDGMALDQWLIVRDHLSEQLPGVRFRDETIFAWIPTVTAVARQAIFAGKSPFYFPDSIGTTAKEPALWSLFWEEQGLSAAGYEKKLRSANDLDRVEQLITRPKMRVIGLVVDQIDTMLHGMTLGVAGLHQQLQLWLKAGFLARLIERLTEAGYEITLTADHGNAAAVGIGRPGEQALADLRGERVRVYQNETLRAQVQQKYTAAIAWPPEGLPPTFYPLLAPERTAFIPQGETTLTHGGALLEEVIVPYIKIER